MAKETGEINLTAISPTPQTGAEFLERVDAMEKAGIDMRDIIIRTGYFKKGGDYGQANIDFFNAKLAAQKADGSWQKARDKEEADRIAYREEVNKRYEILANKRVCITGKLTYPRHMIEDWLSIIGAIAVSDVSKTTDVLIVGDKPGSKLDKAKGLDIKILQETEAIQLLDEAIDDGLPEGWEKPIIDKFISGLTDTNTDGYLKIIDHEATRVVRLSSKEEVNEWLSDQVNEGNMVYEELASLKWVEVDTVNNVTAWYYDEECDDITDFEVQTFNTQQDIRAFLDEVNSNWGGHLSTIKVLYKTEDKTKIIVGSELEKAKYPHWDSYYDRVFNNLEAYPELLQLFSPDIKKQAEDTPDTARKELDEIIRKGLWPTKALPETPEPTKKQYKLATDYSLLLVVTKEDWEQSIDGDPYHDGKWIHVRDEAKDLDLMRFTNGDALVDSETEQLISTDEIRKKYHLYDVELVECLLSSNYSEEVDYYELWEMAMGDGDIDEEEVNCTVLDAWLKDGKYWAGKNGGYIEQRELSPEIAASLKDALEEDEEEYIPKIGDKLAKHIIDQIIESLPEITTKGYFKLSCEYGRDVPLRVHSKQKLREWLTDRVGVDSNLETYTDYEDLTELKVEWVKIDPDNCVSVSVFWEQKYDLFLAADWIEADNIEHLNDLLFDERDALNGHLAGVHYIETVNGNSTFLLAEDSPVSERFWPLDWDDLLENNREHPDLIKLVGGAEAAAELSVDDFKKLVGSGQFPNGAINKDEEDAVVAKSIKQEMFEACLEEGDLTEILSNADGWMFYIGKNIEALAEFFNEENPYAITGNEPEWMLELFKDNGVVTC